MPRRSPEDSEQRRSRPATTPEEREHELINLASDEAERQIRAGTASSQVITHFLKLGSSRELLEQERIRHEVELARVKREALEGAERTEELYKNALDAMRGYQGLNVPDEDETQDL